VHPSGSTIVEEGEEEEAIVKKNKKCETLQRTWQQGELRGMFTLPIVE